MLNGLLDLSFWGHLAAALLLTHITIVSVTIFLHRHQSHRALGLHPIVSHFFRFWLWLTTGMVTKEWVAVHRKHHALCEGPEDPHSPQVYGIRKVLLEGAELYRAEADRPETLERYGRGTPDDWLERNVYSRFPMAGVALMLVLDLVLFGLAGIAVWGVQMIWIPLFAAGVINGLGHYLGYRNFETGDASTNLGVLGLLIGGEELHNNHHAYPGSAKFSNKWWELDIGWFYIRLLASVGLAKVKRVAPKAVVRPGKHTIDIETVRAVLHTRFHVLKLYGRTVIMPVLRAEMRRGNEALKRLHPRARRALVREGLALDPGAQETLRHALQRSKALATVWQFRQQLTELWLRSASSQERTVSRLQEWCQRAEQTGIDSLQEFARRLRGYSLQPG